MKTTVRTCNIKEGMPRVEEGLRRLAHGLNHARQNGAKVLRVVHGYGSGGSGGAIKEACRAFLARELAARRIKAMLPGEDYLRQEPETAAWLRRWPDLKAAERTDTRNPGITLVEV